MDIDGIALSFTITTFINLILTSTIPLCIANIRDAIFFPTKETLQNWSEYFNLLLPAFLTEAALIFPMELYLFLSGLFNEVEQATQVSIFNLIFVNFTLG